MASGAVRNHDPELMVKAFEIAGYSEKEVETRFGALYMHFNMEHHHTQVQHLVWTEW